MTIVHVAAPYVACFSNAKGIYGRYSPNSRISRSDCIGDKLFTASLEDCSDKRRSGLVCSDVRIDRVKFQPLAGVWLTERSMGPNRSKCPLPRGDHVHIGDDIVAAKKARGRESGLESRMLIFLV